jgi:hypothetical protein
MGTYVNICIHEIYEGSPLYFDFVSNLHKCRNPTLAKCGGEAQHLEKLGI